MYWIGYVIAAILFLIGVVFVGLGFNKIINSPPIPGSKAEKEVKNNTVTGAVLMVAGAGTALITALITKQFI